MIDDSLRKLTRTVVFLLGPSLLSFEFRRRIFAFASSLLLEAERASKCGKGLLETCLILLGFGCLRTFV